jgi:2TM domain
MRQRPTRGEASEPVAILPGPGVREAGDYAELEQWAWRRVRSLRAFYNHATVYVIANFVILLIDISTPGGAWFYDVLLGWGLFLGLHALYAYELVPWSTLDWEHRTAKKLIEFRLRK